MKFNINNYVKVKLTDRGRKILEDQHAEIKKSLPNAEPLYIPDEDGFVRFQLWELISTFGKHIYHGCDIPFETTIDL